MGRFSKFNSNLEEIKKQMEEAKKNPNNTASETPAGEYNVKVERLEVKPTKDGRPMLSAMFRIQEGKQRKRCIFFNRVLAGTKNDGNMIKSAVGWLKSLGPSDDIEVLFEDYDQFDELVMDIAEDVSELSYDIDYDPDKFNSVSVTEVYE